MEARRAKPPRAAHSTHGCPHLRPRPACSAHPSRKRVTASCNSHTAYSYTHSTAQGLGGDFASQGPLTADQLSVTVQHALNARATGEHT